MTVLLGGLGVAAAAPAQADAYAYWGFHQWRDGDWTAAAKGPDQVVPDDGTVQGWRYAVADESSPPRVPRAAGDFDAICGSTKRSQATKRVAVVIDFGLAKHAPEGQRPSAARGACAVVPTDASSADALADVRQVRTDDQGMVCGIDGYPRSGCSEPSEIDPDTATSEPSVELKLPDAGAEGSGGGNSDTGSANGARERDADSASETAEESGTNPAAVAGVVVVALVACALVLAAVRRSRKRDADA